MNRLHWIGVLIATFLLVPQITTSAEDTATLRVRCQPGFAIRLDGHRIGVTIPGQGGRTVTGLTPGRYTLRVTKPHFETRSMEIVLEAGSTLEVDFGEAVTASKTDALNRTASRKVIERRDNGRSPQPPTSVSDPTRSEDEAAESGKPPTAASESSTKTGGRQEPETVPAGRGGETGTRVVDPIAGRSEHQGGVTSMAGFTLQYQAVGASAAQGRSVEIWRQRSEDLDPILALSCTDGPTCQVREEDKLAPGVHHLSIVFRHVDPAGPGDEVIFEHVAERELEVHAGGFHMVDARYGDDDPDLCQVSVTAIPGS